ncbi:hypothetical protein LEP1GSC096_3184 [Leptospira interrogans serovar Hebdomadis str. R499]|nr:hypothetical protein LEP1GSC087_3617 [Leptospira interrogans serovar Bataviae str. L1111]EKR34583.1 hypothetical protein LEP1GSC096_3184 [Leptospira interrogans serovar Hebdomadis str. R499]
MLSQTQRLTLYMDRSTDRVRNSVERFLWIAFYIKTKEE